MLIRNSTPYNKYYIRTVNGGWNLAIEGKPCLKQANVLANCVGYANGRFAEIQGLGYIKYQLVCNAENFIENAKKYGLQIVDYPSLGGIMCWQKGQSLSGNDGAGHVAIVEKIINKNTIYTSESSYGGFYFYNATRKNDNGRWGCSEKYKFRGCIVNPAIGDIHFKDETMYDIGKTYTLQVDLNVRTSAGTNYPRKLYSELTPDGKNHAYKGYYAVLKNGTRVTCQSVYLKDNETWLKIPSGFVCANYKGKEYIK